MGWNIFSNKRTPKLSIMQEYAKSTASGATTAEEILEEEIIHVKNVMEYNQKKGKTGVIVALDFQIEGLDVEVIKYFTESGITAFRIEDKRLPLIYIYVDWKPEYFFLNSDESEEKTSI